MNKYLKVIAGLVLGMNALVADESSEPVKEEQKQEVAQDSRDEQTQEEVSVAAEDASVQENSEEAAS